MLERIMIALDGSALAEQTLPFAAAVARACDAEIILLRVIETNNGGAEGRALDSFDWRIGRAEAIEYLSEIERRLKAEGIPVDIDTASGRASDEILELARVRNVDLIVVGSHGRRGLTQFRMASTAQKVVFGAETSVLVVPSVEGGREGLAFTSVLVPVDGSPHSDWAVSVAARIARFHEVDLVVLHVVREPELLDPQGTPREAQLVEELVSLNKRAAKRYLSALKRRFERPGMTVQSRLEVADDVAPVLRRQAELEDRPLVVLSTVSGCGGGIPGSLVTALLSHARQPLLLLRQESRGEAHRRRWSTARLTRSAPTTPRES